MIREKADLLQKKFNKDTKQFLQSFALVLICAVFILLILIAGIMDLKRIDNTLIGFMQNRGLDIVGNVQRVAQNNYNSLIQLIGGEQAADAISPFSDEAFPPQENLIQALVNLGKHVDQFWDNQAFGQGNKLKFADREGLKFIVIFDSKGQLIFQSRSIPQSILIKAAPVVAGQKDILIELYNKFGKTEKLGFIAVRRSSGAGTIIMALDEAGFHFWAMRVAIQRAIEQAGWGKGIAYISVVNEKGQYLGSAGDDSEIFKKGAKGNYQEKLQNTVSHRKISYHGKDILEISSPIMIDGKIAGTARVGLERERADQILRENRNNMFFSLMAIMLIGVISIWFLLHNQNRHFIRIEEMNKRLQQSERLSSLGQLAAGVAHEIRNPLNAISMAGQRLQREYLPLLNERKGEEFKGLTSVIRDEIRRLNGIIEEFLNFSRTDRLELKEYPIEDVLQKLISLIEEEATARSITIKKEWNHHPSLVQMDVDKLQQAFLNLLKNGMESIPDKGSLTIGVEHAQDGVEIKITDTGCGLKPEELDRIFSPEYTTKEKGLGLGLPISHEIIRAHRGDIRVKSQIGVGSTFEIRLPISSKKKERVHSVMKGFDLHRKT